MPWEVKSPVSRRLAFVRAARQPGATFSALCRQFGVSRQNGYKWLARFEEGGPEALEERSRRPRHSPGRADPALEARVVALREHYPAWGGRKLRKLLEQEGLTPLPSPSTVTAILHRHGLVPPAERHPPATQRFEHPTPNALWQMDFKGHFALERGRCHPLTLLDDHSRFNLCLQACPDERGLTVQAQLTGIFQRYGLPERMLMDNGSPWGDDADSRHTSLTVWLLRLGVAVSHGRPYHPQTQGKLERFHRSLHEELLSRRPFADLPQCQDAFDQWRAVYNHQRPHDALDLAVPASRYQPSPRPFPATLPTLEYPDGALFRKVQAGGFFTFQGREYRLSKAFRDQTVGLVQAEKADTWAVYFGPHRLTTLSPPEARP